MRRGWEPDGDAQHRSITEIEYDSAKPNSRFVYMTNEQFPVPGNLRETNDEHRRQLGFRIRVKTRIVAQCDFSSPEALAAQIVRELLVHVQRQPRDTDPLASLPDAVANRILQLLDERGDLQRAEQGGLERDTVLKLAKRLKPDDALDFDRAVAELENAITIALDVIAHGKRETNEDEFVNDVLKSVATHTQAGDNERATRELDDALKELDTREAEQRATLKRLRLTLLEAGVSQDLLRRDANAAAKRAAHLAEVEQPVDPARRFDALRRRWQTFWDEGRDKGLSLSLEVAIEIARVEFALADTADRRGTALHDLGIALRELGERESGSARLNEAIAAYRDALKERTRARTPLDWATAQNSLGNALAALGERESGTTRLDEAVAPYREALKESTRKRAPLQWAATQNNLGTALQALAQRESATARYDEAVAAYREALKEWTRERVPLDWATAQNNLGTALQGLADRESGTARLDNAVAAYSEALKERTRERVPLDWASTQHNLGAALQALGERESGTARLDEAIVAFREALKEYTREHVPLHGPRAPAA